MPYPVYYQGAINITPRLTVEDAELFAALGDFKPNEQADEVLASMQAASKVIAKWYAGMLRLSRRHGILSLVEEESSHGAGLWLKLLIEHFFAPRGYVLSGRISWKASERAEDRGCIFVKDNRIEAVDDLIFNPGPAWDPSPFASPNLKLAVQSVVDSADDTGCTEDLTVVEASAVETLRSLVSRL
jgi:hypothetical protein